MRQPNSEKMSEEKQKKENWRDEEMTMTNNDAR